MQQITQLGIIIISIVALLGCAKERPLKPVVQDASRLSKSIFQGQYLYQKSIAKVRNPGELIPLKANGFYLVYDEIVSFEIKENRMHVVALDPLFTHKGLMTDRKLASFKVEHVDVMRKQNSDGKDTHEEEVTKDRRPWHQRDYLEVDFTEDGHTTFGQYVELVIPPSEIEIDGRSINFVTTKELSDGSSVDIRHSFLRFEDNPNYTQKKYSRHAQTRLGLFATKSFDLKNLDENGELIEDDLTEFMNRWDLSKKIVYYFSGNYPEHLKAPTREVFRLWNEAFKEATGKDVLEIRENTGQQVGDLRYNLIHYDDTPGGSNLLGYGPSVTNPRTGEIIKADTFLYGSTLKRSVRYTKLWAEAFTDEQENEGPAMTPASKVGPLNSAQDIQSLFFPISLDGEALGSASTVKNLMRRGKDEDVLAHFYEIGPDGAQRFKIDTLMKDARALLLGQEGGNEAMHLKNAIHLDATMLAMIKEGVLIDELSEEELEIRVFMPLLAHEMGHNFGMRHNFMGSMDEKHFDEHTQSSSVMDYAFALHEPLGPAAYDKALIKVVYGKEPNALEKFKEQNFYYCTDHQVMSSRSIHCGQHDYGTSLEGIAKAQLKRYNTNYEIFNKRADRIFFNRSHSQYLNRIATLIIPMRLMYDHASAILEAGRSQNIPSLWRLMQQRIEADPNSTNRLTLQLPDGDKIFIDPEKINPAIQDAARAKAVAFTSLVDVLQGVDKDGQQKPDFDQSDIVHNELQTKGVILDKIFSLLMLGSQTSHPVNSTPLTMYEDLDEPLSELFRVVISGVLETNTVPQMLPINPNLRYVATDLLAGELGVPGQITAEAIELIRVEPTNGSQDETDALNKVDLLRENFRTVFSTILEDSFAVEQIQREIAEIEAIIKIAAPEMKTELQEVLKETQEKLAAKQKEMENKSQQQAMMLQTIQKRWKELNVASVSVGHHELKSPLNLGEIELGLDLNTVSGTLIKNKVNFVEDFYLVQKDHLDNTIIPAVEAAKKLVEQFPGDRTKQVTLRALVREQSDQEETITNLRRYIQTEKQYVGALFRIYSPN